MYAEPSSRRIGKAKTLLSVPALKTPAFSFNLLSQGMYDASGMYSPKGISTRLKYGIGTSPSG